MENKKTVIFIIILIIIILGLGGFIAVDKLGLLNKDNVAEKTQLGDIEVDLNSFTNINDTMVLFNKTYGRETSNFLGYLYSKNKITVDDFDKQAALYASIYDSIHQTTEQVSIPGGVIKSKFENVFGKKQLYEPGNINVSDNLVITYDEASDNYIYTYIDIDQKIDNIYQDGYIETNISTKLDTEKIIIKRKAFYVEYLKDEQTNTVNKANIYNSHDKTKLIATIELKNNVLNTKEVISKYGSKINTYIYTIKQKTYDEYSFYSIEKDK